MANTVSGLVVMQEYFGGSRKIDMSEFKALTLKERDELAAGAARELGYRTVAQDGKTMYFK